MAANSLGRLTLDLLVQTAEFTGPLSQAERQARTASKILQVALTLLRSLLRHLVQL